MAKIPDRRVQRTRRLLRGALLSLIQERGFETLSVQDIVDRANVGRATFYAHFDNKEDLLVSGFDELRASLKEKQREALSRGAGLEERGLGFSQEMFGHADGYREVFQAMAGKRSGAMIQNLVRKILLDAVREDVRVLLPRGKVNPAATEALVQFIAGGMLALLMWWLDEKKLDGKRRLSAEELTVLFRQFSLPAIGAALR